MSSDVRADARFGWVRDALSGPGGQQTLTIWLVCVVVVPVSGLLRSGSAFSLIGSTLELGLFLACVAFGQGLVILSGGFDLSVASVVALSAYLSGRFVADGVNQLFAVVAVVLICAIVGAISGALVGYAKFPPFIVTLAVGSIVAAVSLGLAHGQPSQQAPPFLSSLFGHEGKVVGVPYYVILVIAVGMVGWLIQSKSVLGRKTYALGGGLLASEIARIRPRITLVFVYLIAAVAYSVAGMLLLGYSGASNLNIGDPWLLASITAVAVGGSAVSGGSGSFVATLGGSLLLTVIGIDIASAGYSAGWQQIIYGLVILAALLVSRFTSKAGDR